MTLQTIWFVLVAVLISGYAVLDGFDLGVGILHLFVAKDDRERRTSLNSIGPVWDGNEVWLLTGGGALFAAFPPVYATVFSGFYLALILVLVALILRAVSLEFRSKGESPAWRLLWDRLFSIGSALAALLFGVAVGNLMRGIPVDAQGNFTGSFFSLLNPFSLVVGLLGFVMFTMQGAVWLTVKTEGEMQKRAEEWAWRAYGAFVVLYFVTAGWGSVAARPVAGRYFAAPAAWLAMLPLVLGAVLVPLMLKRGKHLGAFYGSSLCVAGLTLILAVGAFPLLVPSTTDPAFSLTAYNASSTPLTLKVMFIIALVGMPLVIGYTAWIYKQFRGKVKLEETSY